MWTPKNLNETKSFFLKHTLYIYRKHYTVRDGWTASLKMPRIITGRLHVPEKNNNNPSH